MISQLPVWVCRPMEEPAGSQLHHHAHAGIVKLADDGLALAALEVGQGIGGHGVEIKDHKVLL